MDATIATDRLLDENETAKLLKVHRQTLASWRCSRRQNLPFIKVGRSVRYRLSAIEKFLNDSTVGGTAASN